VAVPAAKRTARLVSTTASATTTRDRTHQFTNKGTSMKYRSHPIRRSAAVLAVTLASGASALGLAATAAHAATTSSTTYTFTTLDNQADPTFNQLLGINNHNVISGYFGSGAAGHPNKGYLLDPPYAQSNYVNENYPGSAQTQVTGLNGKGDTSGFWANKAGTNNGFVEWNGAFETLNDPSAPHTTGAVDQLLGVNNNGVAVGFYTGPNGFNHAYEVNQATQVYTQIHVSGAASKSATGINNLGDIVGVATTPGGTTTYSWLLKNGHMSTYQFPGGSDTQAFGVNDHDEIVGTYMDSSGVQHGFTLKDPLGPVSHWQTVDDPAGAVGDTFINGLNDAGDLVGFWCPSATNCNGFLATP
jgi:probable HAF family extracellular repeat protein